MNYGNRVNLLTCTFFVDDKHIRVAAPATSFCNGRNVRPLGRNVDPGNTLSRSDAKTCVGPERDGRCDVVMRSLGVAFASLKNEANLSEARSACKSWSLWSATMVSSNSRRVSSVAGTSVFIRSCLSARTLGRCSCTSLSFGWSFSAWAHCFRSATFALDFSILTFLKSSCRFTLLRILEMLSTPIMIHCQVSAA
jgi:hypothetical protein